MKAGYVGVVGLPNTGKSTLVNHLCGAKVGITSNKPQTTRKNILGVKTNKDQQVVFVDSPGFIQAEKGLNAFLESQWRRVLEDVDALVFVVSLDSKKESVERIFTMIETINKPYMVVITKTDLKESERLFVLEEELKRRNITYYKSKRLGKTQNLSLSPKFMESLSFVLPETDHFYYDQDIYTTQTLRDLSSEIILETVFRNLSNELPYESCVVVRDFKDEGSLYKIYADILVSKDRYKKIVIGRGGQTIKRIGMESRKTLEKEFSNKIFLDLNVKVKENWNKLSSQLREAGYYEQH
jgi:GTP-binding protein Era